MELVINPYKDFASAPVLEKSTPSAVGGQVAVLDLQKWPLIKTKDLANRFTQNPTEVISEFMIEDQQV